MVCFLLQRGRAERQHRAARGYGVKLLDFYDHAGIVIAREMPGVVSSAGIVNVAVYLPLPAGASVIVTVGAVPVIPVTAPVQVLPVVASKATVTVSPS